MANQSVKITINQPPAEEDQNNENSNNNYKMNNGVVQHNKLQDDKKQGFVQDFRNSVDQENIIQAQEQMDQSKAEQNAKNKKKLMLKSVAQFQKISNLKNSNDQNTLKTNFMSKIRKIVTKMKVAPQKKLTRDEIIKKYQKAYMIIKTVVRLNKISENIRNYGTSSNLFDVATRDRPTVKKVLFPLTAVTEEEEEQELSEALQFPLIQPNSIVNKIWNPIYMVLMIYTATIMPYRISFEDEIQTGWSVVDYITDSLFWIDMFINMFTAYYNEDGQLVKNRKAVMYCPECKLELQNLNQYYL
ncbi:hypothetical protein PPERSA_02814 [Pseudocohnilembus persalinus]|uniref:Uncharacterized protein n=1 Tax=Pseudocohnilembus persalinus TaxID=266149 RepID=A0A0V0QME6_PSEPJ|nr:hypothetical protein PPERSA_02814 [Pseudocohnilembus persalinus]|eukprot:KRX03435.1 hypothetical protein PPERSA_02814 [Pseudocohnilembus persalinus]